MSDDKRRSYRYPVREDCTPAIVRAGRKEWPAVLVNESAGGFLFSAPTEAGLRPGHKITLSVYSGSYLVEVVHTRTEGDRLMVGVRRFDAELQPPGRAGAGRRRFATSAPDAAQPTQTLLFFGAYVGIALLSMALILGGREGGFLTRWTANNNSAASAAALARLSANLDDPLDASTAHTLEGINSLTSEEIRRAVGLTSAQHRSLDRIFSDTAQRLHALYVEKEGGAGGAWSDRSSAIVNDAVQRVLCTLTDQQIERWRLELLNAVAANSRPEIQPVAP